MLVILLQCVAKPGGFVIEHIVFGAYLFDDRLDVWEMAVIDTREEMVFDLKVQSTGERVH